MNETEEFVQKVAQQIRDAADTLARKAVASAMAVGQVVVARPRVYLAGPMRGKPEFNFPAFFEGESALHGLGYDVWSPARAHLVAGDSMDENQGPENQHKYAKRDLGALMTVGYIALLNGWQYSKGASAEVAVARWLGLPVLLQRPDLTWTEPQNYDAYVSLREPLETQAVQPETPELGKVLTFPSAGLGRLDGHNQ